jgi:hypothetical protein
VKSVSFVVLAPCLQNLRCYQMQSLQPKYSVTRLKFSKMTPTSRANLYLAPVDIKLNPLNFETDHEYVRLVELFNGHSHNKHIPCCPDHELLPIHHVLERYVRFKLKSLIYTKVFVKRQPERRIWSWATNPTTKFSKV